MILRCNSEELGALRKGSGMLLYAHMLLHAHALAVFKRVSGLGQEMEGLIEVVTGAPATPKVAASFRLPS